MLQVLLLWNSTLSGSCEFSTKLAVLAEGGDPSIDRNGTKNNETGALLQLAGIAWVLMHVFGGIIRSMVHIEPYYDIPEDPDEPEAKVILF
mmetsp:Transcript_19799/g.30527  ORF Transcript_19799/g.30527 Transcript_19799/m.30527 type:complete len:91 (-) Transcript_19799:38-310(-)